MKARPKLNATHFARDRRLNGPDRASAPGFLFSEPGFAPKGARAFLFLREEISRRSLTTWMWHSDPRRARERALCRLRRPRGGAAGCRHLAVAQPGQRASFGT